MDKFDALPCSTLAPSIPLDFRRLTRMRWLSVPPDTITYPSFCISSQNALQLLSTCSVKMIDQVPLAVGQRVSPSYNDEPGVGTA